MTMGMQGGTTEVYTPAEYELLFGRQTDQEGGKKINKKREMSERKKERTRFRSLKKIIHVSCKSCLCADRNPISLGQWRLLITHRRKINKKKKGAGRRRKVTKYFWPAVQ